jgi:hypothetical protein
MFGTQALIGFLAALVGVVGYVPYFRDILRGKTKPHPFSWIIFTILLAITFFAQISSGGGPGAWVSGVSAIGVGGVTVLAFIHGEKTITRFDWICFVGALAGVILWHRSSNPLSAIAIVTTVNMVAFVPTWRKAYRKPYQETISFYVIAAVKYFISLFALATFDLTTALFPLAVILSNVSFVTMLVLRRSNGAPGGV